MTQLPAMPSVIPECSCRGSRLIPPIIEKLHFSSLYEVGIALNLSYSLFEQVRTIGKRRAERSIKHAIKEWKDAAELLDNESAPVDNQQIKNVEKTADQEVSVIRNNAGAICANWVQACVYAALFCFMMLSICAVWGSNECTFGRGFGWCLLAGAVISCSTMPLALFHIRHTWKTGEKKIKDIIEHNRQSWDIGNNPKAAVQELNRSVDG